MAPGYNLNMSLCLCLSDPAFLKPEDTDNPGKWVMEGKPVQSQKQQLFPSLP